MNARDLFSYSTYEEQDRLAERELFAFIRVVTELFGAEQARSAARDWLDEADLIDAAPFSSNRDWRSVTISASARLARRTDTP
jgi:hypothetical protein